MILTKKLKNYKYKIEAPTRVDTRDEEVHIIDAPEKEQPKKSWTSKFSDFRKGAMGYLSSKEVKTSKVLEDEALDGIEDEDTTQILTKLKNKPGNGEIDPNQIAELQKILEESKLTGKEKAKLALLILSALGLAAATVAFLLPTILGFTTFGGIAATATSAGTVGTGVLGSTGTFGTYGFLSFLGTKAIATSAAGVITVKAGIAGLGLASAAGVAGSIRKIGEIKNNKTIIKENESSSTKFENDADILVKPSESLEQANILSINHGLEYDDYDSWVQGTKSEIYRNSNDPNNIDLTNYDLSLAAFAKAKVDHRAKKVTHLNNSFNLSNPVLITPENPVTLPSPEKDTLKANEKLKISDVDEIITLIEKPIESKNQSLTNELTPTPSQINKESGDVINSDLEKYKKNIGYVDRIVNYKTVNTLEALSLKNNVRAGLEEVFKKCPPTNELIIDGQKFLISDIYQPETGYPHVIIWGNRHGELMPRLVYKSQSSGTWRMDMKGNTGHYEKGDHYTESSKLAPEIVACLDNQVSIRNISDQEVQELNFMDNIDISGPEESWDIPIINRIGSLISPVTVTIQNKRPIQKINQNHLEKGVFANGFFDFSHHKKGVEYDDYINIIGSLDSKFVPDFIKPYVNSYSYTHTLIGPVDVFTYINEIDGQKFEYEIAKPKDGSLPFINSINKMNSPIMSVGVLKDVCEFGSLQMKPIEYKDQLPTSFRYNQEFKSPIGKDGHPKNNYIDIRPFLVKSPVLQAYLKSQVS